MQTGDKPATLRELVTQTVRRIRKNAPRPAARDGIASLIVEIIADGLDRSMLFFVSPCRDPFSVLGNAVFVSHPGYVAHGRVYFDDDNKHVASIHVISGAPVETIYSVAGGPGAAPRAFDMSLRVAAKRNTSTAQHEVDNHILQKYGEHTTHLEAATKTLPPALVATFRAHEVPVDTEFVQCSYAATQCDTRDSFDPNTGLMKPACVREIVVHCFTAMDKETIELKARVIVTFRLWV